MSTAPICPHAASGCNAPEGECLGLCISARVVRIYDETIYPTVAERDAAIRADFPVTEADMAHAKEFFGMAKITAGEHTLIPLTKESLDKLRAIRLYHWRKCLEHRKQEMGCAQAYNEGKPPQNMLATKRLAHQKLADAHLGMVQTMNEFFPDVGDTAERDEERAKG